MERFKFFRSVDSILSAILVSKSGSGQKNFGFFFSSHFNFSKFKLPFIRISISYFLIVETKKFAKGIFSPGAAAKTAGTSGR